MIEKQLADDRLYDLLYRDALPGGDLITDYLESSSDLGLQFGAGAVNETPIQYADGSTHPAGTVIQLRIFSGSLSVSEEFKIGKLRVRFKTLRDDVVESVFNITLRK